MLEKKDAKVAAAVIGAVAAFIIIIAGLLHMMAQCK